MTWTPADTLLATVTEYENFSYSIAYSGIDETTGLPMNFPVTITQLTPKPTVTTSGGVSGYYKFLFNDILQFRDPNENIVTIQGTEDVGAWEIFDINDVYQMTSFQPDTTRFRTFSFLAEAKDSLGATVATTTYTIDVDDRNWTPGMMNLKNAIATTKARGV